jgi:hypothetical protein
MYGMHFGLSCGRQSCLQAAFQAAFEPEPAFQAAFSIRDEFLGLRSTMPATHEAGEIGANCARGRFRIDGGLKGRLQARLPATRKPGHNGKQSGVGMSADAADTSVRATSGHQ